VVNRWTIVGNAHDIDNGQAAEVEVGSQKSEVGKEISNKASLLFW